MNAMKQSGPSATQATKVLRCYCVLTPHKTLTVSIRLRNIRYDSAELNIEILPSLTNMPERMTKMHLVGATLASDVLFRIRNDILSVVLKAGERLRFEALRAQYGASFSTLREALACLVAEQLVIAEGQKGFSVAPMSKSDLIDLTNARVLIECEALRQSLARGDDEWEASMLSAYHRLERLETRLDSHAISPQWLELHSAFHHSLVSSCSSPILLHLRERLFERAFRYRRISSQFRTTVRHKDAEHQAIVEAAVRRQSALATELLERHIRQTAHHVCEFASHLFTLTPEA